MKKILTMIAASALAACSQIDTGNVGVESTLGQVKPETLPPGLYFTMFKTVHEITAKEVPLDLNDMQPKARDNVTLQDIDVTVYYRINPPKASVIMTRYAGDSIWVKDYDGYALGVNLVKRSAREAVYQALALHAASEVHTKRTEVSSWVKERLQKELDEDAKDRLFEITNVVIRNIVTDPGLEKAIKEAAEVEFTIRTKVQQLELARKESERQAIQAEGEARANEIIAKSITPALIELRRIEAMSSFAKQGTHTVVVPSGSTPLIQVK